MAAEARSRFSFIPGRRGLLILLGAVLVLRAALPEVVRRVLVAQMSERLQTRVEIGDVDLSLLRGGVALEDVAIHSPTPQSPDEPPLVSWKKFGIQVRYIPLLWKAVQLRQVVCDGPRVALDRLASGEINLGRLVPHSEPAETAPEPPAESSGWKIGIDRFVLRTGGVRFRDLTLAGGAPLEIAIPDITVNDVALQPGLYGEPGRIQLQVKAEGGAVRIDSRLWPLDRGFALATRVKALRLPLPRARLYIPGFGWREIKGELDAIVDHAVAPDGRNEASGIVRLRNVAIQVPELPQAAFAVERFAARFAPLDLSAHRITLTDVDVGGASIAVDLQGGEVLPLLRRSAGDEKPAPVDAPAAAPAPPPAPWHWAVHDLRLADSKVSLLEEGTPLDIGVRAEIRGLSDDGEPGRLEVSLAVPPGSVAVAGALRVTPPGFGGSLRIERLPLHDVVRAARAAARLPPGLMKTAVLDADLAIAAGLAAGDGAPAPPDALGVKGSLALDGVEIVGEDPKVFAVSWKRLEVPIDQVEMPGVMPGTAPAAPSPIHVALGAVRLEEPAVQVTRTAEGIVLPPPFGSAPASGTEPAAPKPAASPGGAPASSIDVTIGSFTLGGGRVDFADQSMKPSFAGQITSLEVDARGIRSEGPAVDRFTVSAITPKQGKVDITGFLRPEGGELHVNGKELALEPYNPYVASFTSYSLGRGSRLTVKTDVAFAKGKYDAKTALTLHRLRVNGAAGDTRFKQQVGIPLSLALALLRDLQGNIKLDIPVGVDESGTTIGLGTVIGGAVKSAILGAVTSPLKGIGAVFGTGDDVGVVEPPAIKTELGRAAVTADGRKQVDQLAELLAGRPGVRVELDPVVTPADVRCLREQDLRAELEARTGVVNVLRGLPGRGGRRRVMQALAERAAGEKGELDDDDRALLDQWLAERPEIPAGRLRALGSERANAVATALRDEHRIPPDRVSVAETPGEPREGEPGVVVNFDAAGG